MNITVTIGVTPQLEKVLEGLSALLSNASTQFNTVPSIQEVAPTVISMPENTYVAPVQPVTPVVQPSTPPVQAVPVYNPAPTAPAEPVQQAQPQPVPTSAPTYTMQDLAVAATQLMDAGKAEDIRQLLAAFGVQALMQLPKEQYGVFATKLREMGAKI